MASEICQTKNETVVETAGILCNSGEAGHMQVAQHTKFVLSETGGFLLQGSSLLGRAGLQHKHILRSLSLSEMGEGKAGPR